MFLTRSHRIILLISLTLCSLTAQVVTHVEKLSFSPTALWDTLAQGAKWSRQNSETLVDTHWVGGDPGKLEIYGCASWQKDKGILMLRNPDDKAQTISIDIALAFELPSYAPKNYKMKNPWQKQTQKSVTLSASIPHTFKLSPFEVLLLEAMPVTQ